MAISAGLVGAGSRRLKFLKEENEMKRKFLLLLSVLALAACQEKESPQVTATPVPALNEVVTSAVPVAETVSGKPVEPTMAASVVPPKEVAKVSANVPVQKPAKPAKPAPTTKVAAAALVVAEAKSDLVAPLAQSEVASVPSAKPEKMSVAAKPAAVKQLVTPKVAAPTVSDAEGIALAKKRNCFACHALDKKVVGPAWKDVAAKYRGDASAQARLEAKIAKGGSGVWGGMAMPPQTQIPTEERTQIVRFILNLK